MCTIVVHGTHGRNESWWLLKRPGGFLDALAQGMRQGGREPDVWMMNDRPLAEFAPPPPPPNGEPFEHLDGAFRWCGERGHEPRVRDGVRLARYVEALSQVHPSEPINVVAHGHGCNLVKVASHYVRPGVLLGRAVFLGAPYCEIVVGGGQPFPYRLSPQSLSRDAAGAAPVLNLYSQEDAVQLDWSDCFPEQNAQNRQYRQAPMTQVHNAHRVDPDPYTRHAYDNVELPTRLNPGPHVHAAMHGPTAGLIAGYWLARWPEFTGRQVLRNFGIDVVTDPNPG
jgi:hypothetical protein